MTGTSNYHRNRRIARWTAVACMVIGGYLLSAPTPWSYFALFFWPVGGWTLIYLLFSWTQRRSQDY